MSTFEIVDDDFVLDGHPHRILSGAIHYFRVPRQYWEDRVHKARLMGLNTIETYVAWNQHEPTRGVWSTDPGLDLGAFLDVVAAEGMHAIVRPGPYICAEFDGGGLPAWLFADGSVPVRTRDERFMDPVAQYLRHVYEIVVPRQVDRAGPVILVQIENEYGAYGHDHDYLRALRDLTRDAGITVPLTTVDQPRDGMLEAGTLPDLLTTGSFGSRAGERLAEVRRVQPTGPLMCSEFWDGWFDQWGDYHHTTSARAAADELEGLLALGASVNLYMFHGGTNFGLTNGANDKGIYAPITTSYDYDAPLDEKGDPTAKYWAFREVISRWATVPEERPTPAGPAPTPQGRFDEGVPLSEVAEQLGTWTPTSGAPSFDALARSGGLLLATCALPGTDKGGSGPAGDDPLVVEERPGSGAPEHTPRLLAVGEVRDRAVVEADGVRIGVLERADHDVSLALPGGTRSLTLLIEDLGRVDYGPRIGEHKGLVDPVTVDARPIDVWQVLPLELSDLDPVRHAMGELEGEEPVDITRPTFLRGRVLLEEPHDLFLDTLGWGHGLAWVNGHPLGRFSRRSPQRTLYVPAPFLCGGANELLVLEIDPVSAHSWSFLEAPDLGPIDW